MRGKQKQKEETEKKKATLQKQLDLVKNTEAAGNAWWNYLCSLENQCFEKFGFLLEINEMKQKSLMFQFVNDKDNTNQMYYIKQKYEFLERLYWSFVYQF